MGGYSRRRIPKKIAMQKSIIVTGGAGFLGANLCRKLLAQGDLVTCLDNLLTGDYRNVAELISNPNFKFIQWDVSKGVPITNSPIDQIYHLASPASPNINSKKSYHALPFETMKVNTFGTWKLAEYAAEKKIRLLYTSTSEIYGEPLEHPQTEIYRGNVSTTGPRSVYDEAKRFGETIIAAFARETGLDGRIVRIFNTYGPRMMPDDGRVVSEFIYAAAAGRDLEIFGAGEQTRSFCYVDDLIDGIFAMMNQPDMKGEIVNLGNPEEFSINQLAKLVLDITGVKSKITRTKSRPVDDPRRRRPDISKARERLKWNPTTSLKDGLIKYWKFIQSEENK